VRSRRRVKECSSRGSSRWCSARSLAGLLEIDQLRRHCVEGGDGGGGVVAGQVQSPVVVDPHHLGGRGGERIIGESLHDPDGGGGVAVVVDGVADNGRHHL